MCLFLTRVTNAFDRSCPASGDSRKRACDDSCLDHDVFFIDKKNKTFYISPPFDEHSVTTERNMAARRDIISIIIEVIIRPEHKTA